MHLGYLGSVTDPNHAIEFRQITPGDMPATLANFNHNCQYCVRTSFDNLDLLA